MSAPHSDPVIRQYREQISDNDLAILEAMNKRLGLVRRLKEYKEGQGLDFFDAAQEDWVLTYLSRANRGPLSEEALRELFALILAKTKEELSSLEPARSAQEG